MLKLIPPKNPHREVIADCVTMNQLIKGMFLTLGYEVFEAREIVRECELGRLAVSFEFVLRRG